MDVVFGWSGRTNEGFYGHSATLNMAIEASPLAHVRVLDRIASSWREAYLGMLSLEW